MATHATARDAGAILEPNCTIMQQSSCQSVSIAKKSVPLGSKTSAYNLKKVTKSFTRASFYVI